MKIDTTVMAMATDVAAKAHPSCSSRTDQAAAKMAKTASSCSGPGTTPSSASTWVQTAKTTTATTAIAAKGPLSRRARSCTIPVVFSDRNTAPWSSVSASSVTPTAIP